MGSSMDKLKGAANEGAGKVKEGVGKATHNERLQADGVLQQGKGKAEKAKGNLKEGVKKTIDRV